MFRTSANVLEELLDRLNELTVCGRSLTALDTKLQRICLEGSKLVNEGEPDASSAAIRFALEQAGGMGEAVDFLRAWNDGDFPEIRRDWPEVPDEVFIGADPLFPRIVAQRNEKTHECYTDADKDRPMSICDSNAQVVLSLCKNCGRGEAELADEPCDHRKSKGATQ